MQDLFLSHKSNFIDNEEFLVLSDLFEWKNPFPYEDYSTFNLDEMTESECLSEFRFRNRAISQMFLAFQRPYGVNEDLLVTAWSAIEVFIHNKLYIYLVEFWVKDQGLSSRQKRHKPSGFEEFVQFEEVFGSIDQIMYFTYHSRESHFHCA